MVYICPWPQPAAHLDGSRLLPPRRQQNPATAIPRLVQTASKVGTNEPSPEPQIQGIHWSEQLSFDLKQLYISAAIFCIVHSYNSDTDPNDQKMSILDVKCLLNAFVSVRKVFNNKPQIDVKSGVLEYLIDTHRQHCLLSSTNLRKLVELDSRATALSQRVFFVPFLLFPRRPWQKCSTERC